MTHKREVYTWAVQYKPGTDLARRFPGPARGRFTSQETAENIRQACINAEHMEVVSTVLSTVSGGPRECACGYVAVSGKGLAMHLRMKHSEAS